jgi:hypothetical protein
MKEAKSYSQFGQDRFVIDQVFKGRRDGYFFEAGAGDGLALSNTLLLERDYGWTGILVEPTKAFRKLKRNRPKAHCDDSCLAAEHKTVTLVEIHDRGQGAIREDSDDNLFLSRALDATRGVDLATMNSGWGEARKSYLKRAVPLAVVLDKYAAPQEIDYFSLDVEGFEYEILRAFPFERYRFNCLGIERPPQPLHDLLLARGYARLGVLGEDTFYVPH